MTDERWDVPNPKLARIAAAESSPLFRECGHCKHRHPRGERCGWPNADYSATCRCQQ